MTTLPAYFDRLLLRILTPVPRYTHSVEGPQHAVTAGVAYSLMSNARQPQHSRSRPVGAHNERTIRYKPMDQLSIHIARSNQTDAPDWPGFEIRTATIQGERRHNYSYLSRYYAYLGNGEFDVAKQCLRVIASHCSTRADRVSLFSYLRRACTSLLPVCSAHSSLVRWVIPRVIAS